VRKGGIVLKKYSLKYCVFTIFAISVLVLATAACSRTEQSEAISEINSNSTERRLQALEDREAIRRLLMNYGCFLDQRDFKSFALLFAENEGEWIGGMGKARGRQAIRRLMEESIGANIAEDAPGNFHLFMNDSIDLDGDRAAATTKWMFVVQNATGKPELFYLGHYEDALVREAGEWKFLRRVVYSDIPADNPETPRKE
jgi:hypothetical protein